MESNVERAPLPELAGVVRTVWIQRTGSKAPLGEWFGGIGSRSRRKSCGGPRLPLLLFRRPCERTRGWYL
jgi:hypothetical protein